MEKSILILSILTFNAIAGTAQVKVIYGDDDRVDVNDSTNPMYVRLAESTAAMISNSKIEELNNMQVQLKGKTLQESGMCESEKFSGQLAVANCSGFLVDKNKLVTAGHCIRSQFDCDQSSWVFNYKADYADQKEFVIDKEDVYKCKSIISQNLDSSTQNDYALIELEKENLKQKPLKFRTAGKPQVGDKLVVIGHPSGLPTKIADGAIVRKVGEVFLTANLDTYGGNSGSAVFNADSGIIEGILVRGEQDYVFNREKGCRESNVVASDAGRGEDVTLISQVEKLEVVEVPEEPEGPTEPEQPTQPAEPMSFWERLLCALFGRCSF